MSLGKQNWQTRNSVTAPDGVIRPMWWFSLCGGLTWLSVNQRLPSEAGVIALGLPLAVGTRNCLRLPIGAACATGTNSRASPAIRTASRSQPSVLMAGRIRPPGGRRKVSSRTVRCASGQRQRTLTARRQRRLVGRRQRAGRHRSDRERHRALGGDRRGHLARPARAEQALERATGAQPALVTAVERGERAVVAARKGTRFRRVSGTWVQPAVTCTGDRVYSAYWVGLGGYRTTSQALEQIGTAADCDSTGTAHYTAWYELVPAAAVTVKLNVRAGDTIAASVAVSAHRVRLHLVDRTTGAAVTRT